MVVGKAQQVLAAVDAPRVAAELTVQRVRDLEHVPAVKARIEAFVALVVGARIEHAVVDDLVVVAVQGLADQGELGFELARDVVEPFHESAVEHVGDVEPEPVDAELVHPGAHAVEQVVDHSRVLQIELDELEVPLPALVPKAVAICRVALERDMEPVLVGRIPALLLHIAKGPEAATHVVEDRIEHHADTALVESRADLGKIVVGAEASVDAAQVACVVSVRIGLEHRIQKNGTHMELSQVVGPIGDLENGRTIARERSSRRLIDRRVLVCATAKAERIDLVERRFLEPHGCLL